MNSSQACLEYFLLIFDKNVPIIVVTAHDDAEERKKCYDLGINEYLTKPIDKELLLQKIKEQILASSILK
ncbi:MAG: response regulator [Bacteroidetes bacterium]|nr:response regulator [Bacteroidota bacterium]